jgi:hypothetical protein
LASRISQTRRGVRGNAADRLVTTTDANSATRSATRSKTEEPCSAGVSESIQQQQLR